MPLPTDDRIQVIGNFCVESTEVSAFDPDAVDAAVKMFLHLVAKTHSRFGVLKCQ